MTIIDLLDQNSALYGNETALVEINPEFEPQSRLTWRDYALMQPQPGDYFFVKFAGFCIDHSHGGGIGILLCFFPAEFIHQIFWNHKKICDTFEPATALIVVKLVQ